MVVLEIGVHGRCVPKAVKGVIKKDRGFVTHQHLSMVVKTVREMLRKFLRATNSLVQLMEDSMNGATGLIVPKVAEGV